MRLKNTLELWKDDVWFTSDTHYAHSNICKATSNWEGKKGTRDFDSLEKMNSTIVDNINKRVGMNSYLFHAGDWSFGGIDKIQEFSNRLVCDNIYLTFGNHDHFIEKNSDYNGVRVREYFSGVSDVLYITFRRTQHSKPETIFMGHYAHLVWDKSHHGALHVFGHSHGTINNMAVGKSMDIGIDNAFIEFGEYRPFSIWEVLKILDGKQKQHIDHHNDKTT